MQVVISSLTQFIIFVLWMPKKSTAPVIEEDQDALDDETFAELAADEKRLHAALQNPQSIRSGHQYR